MNNEPAAMKYHSNEATISATPFDLIEYGGAAANNFSAAAGRPVGATATTNRDVAYGVRIIRASGFQTRSEEG